MHYKTTFLPIGCLRKALLPLVLMLFAMLAPRCSADALAIAPAIPPGTPMLILADDTQAESGAPAGVTVVTATDATLSGAPFALPKKGAIVTPPSPSGADLLVVNFSLPAGSSGVYQVWTAFTLGGVAEQSFELKAGGDGQSLTDRAAWVQSNKVSWRLAWRETDTDVTIYPQDRLVSIETRGKAAGHKQLQSVALVRIGDLPAGMTDSDGGLRATVTGWQPAKIVRRIYVLEGESAAAADEIYGALDDFSDRLRSDTVVEAFSGPRARAIADATGISQLPAMVVMDSTYALCAVCAASASRAAIEQVALLRQPASVGVPATSSGTATDTGAVVDGEPQEWLVAGTWAGPGGLSLAGLDAEKLVRPGEGDPCPVEKFDRFEYSTWRKASVDRHGVVVIDAATDDMVWPKGAGYACLYVKSQAPRDYVLHVNQSGIATMGWLDGAALSFGQDPSPPLGLTAASSQFASGSGPAVARTDQGGSVAMPAVAGEGPVAASIYIGPGWHCLLVKLIMQHKKGDTFAFAAELTDSAGKPADTLSASMIDPTCDLPDHKQAMRLQPIVRTDAPFNLAYAGQPLSLTITLHRLDNAPEPKPVLPVLSFRARLVVHIRDYDGNIIFTRETDSVLPGAVHVDIGVGPPTGYYAVDTTLNTMDGRLIASYPPDGFGVIGGTAAQKARELSKKMATTYYFMTPTDAESVYFPYMERIGIFRNVGGNPGPVADVYQDAFHRSLHLAADLWDIKDPDKVRSTVESLTPYVDAFKGYNEVDISPGVRGTAEQWTSVQKLHYDAVKAVSPNMPVLSASLARPAADAWFQQCLALGMDRYVDAWDVHCYPKTAPDLGGTMSNSPKETELGVLQAYAALGRTNDKPFWIGETGARASHGLDARRWQADMVAKMTACANSRPDFKVIGFLVPWQYSRAQGKSGDIEVAHMPAEAAYYTASALIDGLSYSRLTLADAEVQAGQFGPTTMLWTTGAPRTISFPLQPETAWVRVDVVGRCRPLPVNAEGNATLALSTSPIYVLPADAYAQLTAF